MKRIAGWVAVGLMVVCGTAVGDSTSHPPLGCGFHDSAAPLGVRWWLNGGKLALDAGLGFGSVKDVATNENLSHWAIDLGLPISLRNWERADILFRPGLAFASQTVITGVGPVTTDNATTFRVGAELEAEVFLVDNISVSAAHGFAIENFNPPGAGSSTTDWGTTGNNFTTIGFHVYMGKK